MTLFTNILFSVFLVLGSGKRFHLIKPDDGPMLYLSGIELVTMLPQFRTEDDLLAHLKSMNLHISVRTIQLAMAPNLVFECVTYVFENF